MQISQIQQRPCCHLSTILRIVVAILFLEVARRSPWCRGTPAHVHWSLLRSSNSRDSPRARPGRHSILSPSLFAPPHHPILPHFRQFPSYLSPEGGSDTPPLATLPHPLTFVSPPPPRGTVDIVPPSPRHFATPSLYFCDPHPE